MFLSQKQKRKAIRERKQTNLAKRKKLEKAAPDLLKACKAFVEVIEKWNDAPIDAETAVLFGDAFGQGCKAIANATEDKIIDDADLCNRLAKGDPPEV